MLEFKLLGHCEARYHDQVFVGFPNQQPWLLLCYLVLHHDRLLLREQIASMFWSDASTHTSLKRLRGALWRLRTMLKSGGVDPEGYLRVTESSMGFIPTCAWYVDTREFEDIVVSLQHLNGRDLTVDAAAELAHAVGLYTGEFLEGVYEDWCIIERERLNVLYITSLSQLASFHEANGTYEAGLAYAAKILSLDETREMIHRQVMRLHWLQGDRAGALQQYKRCVQILLDELQVAPMEETTQLYQQIVREGFATTGLALTQSVIASQDAQSESIQLLLEQAHHTLHRLRLTLDQADAELQQISQMLDAIREAPIDDESDA